MNDRRYWSDKFNKWPREVRIIAIACELRSTIIALDHEKRRLKKHYTAHRNAINEKIKRLRNEIAEHKEETERTDSNADYAAAIKRLDKGLS